MELLCEICNTTLNAKIQDCNRDSDTQTITTPHKKKQDKDTKDNETETWYKQAFDLRGLGKITKPAVTKAPKVLFDLDAENSVKTIHSCHLKPTFTLGDDDNKSKRLAPAVNARPVMPPRKKNQQGSHKHQGLIHHGLPSTG
jgi:hypothetical protein